MERTAKLYVLDPEGVLFRQFSEKDIETLNVVFARHLDTLVNRAKMKHDDILLVDSERTEQWENGKYLSDQLPAGMRVFATSVGGGGIVQVGNPIDMSLLYQKINEEETHVGQFLDELPDRVRRQQALDAILQTKDKNRYRGMDELIAIINEDVDEEEIVMKTWTDPHKDLEIELDYIQESDSDKENTLSEDAEGFSSIELAPSNVSSQDEVVDIPFEIEVEGVDPPPTSSIESEPEPIQEEPVVPPVIEEEPKPSPSFDEVSVEPSPDFNEAPHIEEGEEWEEVVDDERVAEDFLPEPEHIDIPYQTIERKNLHLREGERVVLIPGQDGWVENGVYTAPVDEVVEIGPNLIESVPFKTYHRDAPYLEKGMREVVSEGQRGIQADGVIIQDPVDEIILVGSMEPIAEIRKSEVVEEVDEPEVVDQVAEVAEVDKVNEPDVEPVRTQKKKKQPKRKPSTKPKQNPSSTKPHQGPMAPAPSSQSVGDELVVDFDFDFLDDIGSIEVEGEKEEPSESDTFGMDFEEIKNEKDEEEKVEPVMIEDAEEVTQEESESLNFGLDDLEDLGPMEVADEPEEIVEEEFVEEPPSHDDLVAEEEDFDLPLDGMEMLEEEEEVEEEEVEPEEVTPEPVSSAPSSFLASILGVEEEPTPPTPKPEPKQPQQSSLKPAPKPQTPKPKPTPPAEEPAPSSMSDLSSLLEQLRGD